MRRLFMGVLLAAAIALVAAPMGRVYGGLPDGETMGIEGGWEVQVTPAHGVVVVSPSGQRKSVGEGQYAQVDDRGNTYFGSWEKGLFKYDWQTGRVSQVVGPHAVSPPYLMDATNRQMFVQVHDDFVIDSQHALTTGIGVLDLDSGKVRPLLVKKGTYVLALGIRSDGLFVQTFGHNTGHPVFEVLGTDGQLTRLPGNDLPYATEFPKLSPDQRSIAYSYPGAVAVIEVERYRIQKEKGASDPRWRGARLMVTVEGQAREIGPARK